MKQNHKRPLRNTNMKMEIISKPYSKYYGGKNRLFVKGKCECGNEIEMIYSPKSNDYPSSCGCNRLIFKDKVKAKSMRSSYRSMRDRCYDPKHDAYRWYGAKGITVCERWLNGFQYFYEDMQSTWFAGAQIDRHPNKKGNYELENCRWATIIQQQREKSNSKITEPDVLFIRGSKLLQRELADMFGVQGNTISRIKNGKRWKL